MQTYSSSADLSRPKARARFLAGIVYDERGDIPPEEGRDHLQQAQQLAEGVDDWPLSLLARWREAEQWRKVGDVKKGDPTYYATALRLLESILAHPHATPSLRAAAKFELAKIELGLGNASRFARQMEEAQAQAAAAARSGNDEGIWPIAWDELIQVIVRDTRIRGLAKFGGAVNEVDALVAEARGFSRGLVRPMDKVTLPYSQAHVLLRSPDKDDHVRGFELFYGAYRFAEEDGQKRQLASGKKLLGDGTVRSNLPKEVMQLCPKCQHTTLWRKGVDDRRQPQYVCTQCGKPAWKMPE